MMHSPDSLLDWAMPCGTWFGHRVRASALFLVVPVILGLQTWDLRLALIVGIFLLAAVLIHEIALVCAVRLAGGSVRELFLWPLGAVPRSGSSPAPVPPAASIIAGLVSAAVAVMCLPALMHPELDFSLLNPLHLPIERNGAELSYSLLALFFFANWIVLLANLLPAPPFDGGRVVESLVMSRLGPGIGRQVVARIGLAIALAVVLSALLLESVWLCAIGVVLVAYNLRDTIREQTPESLEDSFMGYDFSQGYTSLERSNGDASEPPPGLLRRWREHRRQKKARKDQEKAERADHDLDELLAKVHTYGYESLTDSERRTLKKVAARYRGRSKKSS